MIPCLVSFEILSFVLFSTQVQVVKLLSFDLSRLNCLFYLFMINVEVVLNSGWFLNCFGLSLKYLTIEFNVCSF